VSAHPPENTTPGRLRLIRPAVFLLLNLAGLAIIVWRIEANRPPASTMALIGHWPEDGTAAEKVTEVVVELGGALDPATAVPDGISLVPPVPGRTEVLGGRKLVFRPAEKLRDATRYEIRLDPAIRGRHGERPPDESISFSTRRLRFKGVSQASLEHDGSCILAFEFSGPVDPDELVKHLKLTYPNGESAGFQRVAGKPSATVRVRCYRPAFDRIKASISKELTGTEGPLGLEASCLGTATVSAKLKLVGISADFRRGRGRVRVKMNAPVEVSKAKRFIAVNPPVPFTLDPYYRGFEILGDFQCGQRYRLTIKPGLSAGAVQPLDKELVRTVWFPDKPSEFGFATRGGYLSPRGLLKIPVASTNVKGFELSAERLYASNLVEYVLDRDRWNMGNLCTSGASRKVKVHGRRNRQLETLIDLKDITGGNARGIWRLRLSSLEADCWDSDSTVVVVTDLGASARIWRRRALVWVTSLAAARPAEGVKVTVYSDRRQLLGTALTDARGLAAVNLSAAPEGEDPALVVLSRGADLSYLRFSDSAVNYGAGSHRGRPFLSRGYEAFAFTERGVYRPGDEVRLCGLIRGANRTTPPEMPIELVVFKPGGRRLLRRSVGTDTAGRAAVIFTVPRNSPTGRYRAEWRLPGSTRTLGKTGFRVADYIPRSLRLRLESSEQRLKPGRTLKVVAAAEHLFGDPAANLKVLCRAIFLPEDFRPKGFPGYVFGDRRRPWSSHSEEQKESRLNANGRASFEIEVPRISAHAAMRAELEVEVLEPGGRALCERLTRSVDPWNCYLGVKQPDTLPERAETFTFELAAVVPDGTPEKSQRRFRARFYRVTYSSVLRRSGSGRLTYDWKRHEELMATVNDRFDMGRSKTVFTPKYAGPHRLVVESDGACPAVCDFYVQGPGAGWDTDDPEKLALTLDKTSYLPGETARLAVRGPFGGTALVCVESDRVLESRLVQMAESEATLEFKVSESWRPNVYVTVTVIRPVRAEEDWRPHRASGAACLRVENGDRKLELDLAGPGEARPGRELELAVRVSTDGRARPGAAVVLAAVDEGVLSLTGFPTPDPWGFFYARRRLGVRTFDMYGRLAPELSAWRLGKPADPGGARGSDPGAELSHRLNPIDARRVKTAVLWTGTLVADEKGVARARFLVPEYVGELRIMAAAAAGDRFGSLSKPLKVRSPLMARPSWPRFLAPGDEFDLPVTVFNHTPARGKVSLQLESSGPLERAGQAPLEVEVAKGAEKTVRLRLRATGVGKVSARLTAGLGEETYSESVELAVRPACALARRAGSTVIEAGKETRITLAGDFLPGTGKCGLVVAGSPAVELAGAVGYLLEYPYGCVEQTTSRMVPLIYLHELAAQTCPEMVGAEEIEELLRAGYLRLRMAQTHNGGLAMWPGGGVPYPLGSIYAADVLVEARKAGHKVPGDLLGPLLSYLQGNLGAWCKDPSKWVRGRAAYAAYVLARSGKPPHAWLARLEERLKTEDVPVTARFHLGAAMLAAGQAKAAKAFIGDARPACAIRQSGGYLDSPVREWAVMLRVLLDLDPESKQIPALARRLAKSVSLGRWGTTQENSFALMALGKYARSIEGSGPVQAVATLPDGSERRFGSKEGLTLRSLKPGQSVLIRPEGRGKLWAFWSAEGVPKAGKAKEEDSGLLVRRRILDRRGKPVGETMLKQGELYRVVLTVETRRRLQNVVVTDLLPAGLEIENPDLRGSATTATGTSSSWCVGHVERRDDRLLVFGDLSEGKGSYAYAVRAVTAGTFALPAVEAACMYDPGAYSVHGAGTLTVKR